MISDKDFYVLINYLTVNYTNSETIAFLSLVKFAKPMRLIKEEIYDATNYTLESIGEEYDHLVAHEYLQLVKIDKLNISDDEALSASVKERLKKLYYTYIDNRHKKERLIINELKKMSEKRREELHSTLDVFDKFDEIDELKDIEELNRLEQQQKNISILFKFLGLEAVPIIFPRKVIEFFTDNSDYISKKNIELFNINFELYFDENELLDIKDILLDVKLHNIKWRKS